MLKTFFTILLLLTISFKGFSQTITNSYTFSSNIEVLTTVGANLAQVVSSLPPAYTNVPVWIGDYVKSQIYTNGITTNNLKSTYVLWGEPTPQPKGVFQGNAPIWNGKFYISLTNAINRVRPGDKMHLLLFGIDTSTNTLSSNTVTFNQWMNYLIVSIPTNAP